MESSREKGSDVVEGAGKIVEEGASQLPEIIKQVVDKLTGKNMEVTYDFRNLEVDVPRVTGPEGKEIASAKWKINGKFVLSTTLLETSNSLE
ncbi:hypothetical protein BH18THE1_BH18THE1_11620 [soil metagenome]